MKKLLFSLILVLGVSLSGFAQSEKSAVDETVKTVANKAKEAPTGTVYGLVKENCVGYTKLFTGICNYALKVNHCDGRAMPVVGYIQWCGINLCDAALVVAPEEYKSFVKDHDFVELEYDQKHVYIDPTIYDATGDECTTTISK